MKSNNESRKGYLLKLISSAKERFVTANRKIRACKEVIHVLTESQWLGIKCLQATYSETDKLLEKTLGDRRLLRLRLKSLRSSGMDWQQRPALPYSEERSRASWFKKNDRVIFYLRDGSFKKALVAHEADDIPYVRIKDGTVRTSDEYGFFYQSPLLMHPWEFEYMRKHPEFISSWIKAGRRSESPTGFPEKPSQRRKTEQEFRKGIINAMVEEMG